MKKTNENKNVSLNKKYTFSSWGPQENFNPIIIKKAQGVYLWDEDDKKYLDFASQLVVTNIGHSDPRVLKAMEDQMREFQYVIPGHGSQVRGELGKKLADITPGDLCKTFFTLGGAEANENALKIARLYTGKKKILARYRAYHGGTHATASAGGDPRGHLNDFDLPWIVRIHDPYYLRSPLYKNMTPEKGDMMMLDLIEETIKLEGPQTVAGILVEGYSGSSGVIQATTKAYWKGLRKLCDKYNILMIDDEVMSGFGRTGKWFGIEHFGVVPDIMTMAKGLTSGYAPLGAVIVNKKIAHYFDDHVFNCGLTYSSHAISLAAASACIDIYKKDKLIKRSEEMGKYLKLQLLKLKKKHPSLGDIRGEGLHWVLDLVKDRNMTPVSEWNKPLTPVMKKVVKVIKDNRLQLISRWNWIFITPPLIITKEQIDEGLAIIDKALSVSDKAFKA